jgi:multicomponent Na+:H+ antiporter subunit E
VKRFLHRAISFVSLLALWLLLWGRVTPANVVGGTLVIAFVLWVAPAGPTVAGSSEPGRFHPIATAIFAIVFLKEIVLATWQVAVLVVVPNRVQSGVIRVQLAVRSPRIATVVANAVTLTPGTMTIDDELNDDGIVLYVHALDATDPSAIRQGVKAFEQLAVRSFGNRHDRDALKPEDTK